MEERKERRKRYSRGRGKKGRNSHQWIVMSKIPLEIQSALSCSALLCSAPSAVGVQYSTVQYSTVQYSTVQYSTVQYSTVQYSAVQCSAVQSTEGAGNGSSSCT